MSDWSRSRENSFSELPGPVVEALERVGISGPKLSNDKSFDYDFTKEWESWLKRYIAEDSPSISASSSRTNLSNYDGEGYLMDLSSAATEDFCPEYPDWRGTPLMIPLGSDHEDAAYGCLSTKWEVLSPTTPHSTEGRTTSDHAMTCWDGDSLPFLANLPDSSASKRSTPRRPCGIVDPESVPVSEASSPASAHHGGPCVFCAHFLDVPVENAVTDVLHSLSRRVLDASTGVTDQEPAVSTTVALSPIGAPRSPDSQHHVTISDIASRAGRISDEQPYLWKKESFLAQQTELLSDSELPGHDSEKQSRKRRDWTADEDQRLRQLVEAFLRSSKSDVSTATCKQTQYQPADISRESPGLTSSRSTSSSASAAKSRIPWTQIASRMRGRSAARCRERYRNYLDPLIRHEPFTPKEDTIILAEYKKRGTAWAYIASKLSGRSENAVKNRLHSLLRQARRSVPATMPMPLISQTSTAA